MMNKRILIVGAGGFVGGFIVDQALQRGYETWAGVRKSTSRQFLQDSRIRFVELDFEQPDTLATTLKEALPEGERWDYIIYNLGATKCTNFADFNRINHDYLRSFTDALTATEKMPEKFLYMSSLSALGPGDEKGFTPFHSKSIPTPNTRYGASKLKAEMHLAMTTDVPYIIFRATGIYGPHEKDYFMMFKSIKAGFDFSVGLSRQLLSFIYVDDLVEAMFQALDKAPVRKTYLIAEDRSYTQKEFREIAAKELGKSLVIPMCMPIWAVYIVSFLAEKWGMIRLKPSTLNRDKFNIMKQRNWSVDISEARKDFGFEPKIDLKEGVRRSIKWYKDNNWL